jgi:hypothetical protein
MEAALADAAKRIRPYQAARWALQESGGRTIRAATTWRRGSGDLPPPAELKADAIRLRLRSFGAERTEQQLAGVLSVDALIAAFERWLSVFDSTFMERGDWKVWFQGKDLWKAVRREHPSWPGEQGLVPDLARRVDWRQHLDLVDLHRRLVAFA